MTHLHQHFSKRGFAIIFAHDNGSRAFVDTFGINAYDNLPSPLRSRGYINSFGTKEYFIFVGHFSSRGSLTSLVQTSTSATMDTTTASTTPSIIEDSVMRANQEGLGENTGRPATLEGEFFCPTLVGEDLEASQQPSTMTTSTTSTMMIASIPQEKMRL
jgi:hypothetical protein